LNLIAEDEVSDDDDVNYYPPSPSSEVSALDLLRLAERNALNDALDEEFMHDQDFGRWVIYWVAREERKRLYREQPPDAIQVQNFHALPLTDARFWNRSTHVSNLIREGFNVDVSVNLSLGGKCPPKLVCSNEHERQYIQQMVADGILEGLVTFNVPHFRLYKPGKLRLIFNARYLGHSGEDLSITASSLLVSLQPVVSSLAFVVSC
jgi:hypothetical protein